MFLIWNKHPFWFFLLISILIISSEGCLQTFARAVQEDWQIQVGDSQTYVYSEFYCTFYDNPYEYPLWIIDEDNNNVTVILKKGLILRYDITFLSPDEARGKITYNKTVTSQEHVITSRNNSGWIGIVVRPSINNRTYWEDYCKLHELYNVEGDFIISTIRKEDEIRKGMIQQTCIWNWKTGWLYSSKEVYFNGTMVTAVTEIFLISKDSSLPFHSFIIGGFILVVIVLFLLRITKYK